MSVTTPNRQHPTFKTLPVRGRRAPSTLGVGSWGLGVVIGSLVIAAAVPLLAQTFRARVDLVHFPIVVTDKEGAPITGLTKEDFEVVEQGKAQSITYFAVGDPNDSSRLGEVLPLHLGLALDTSGSMDQDIHEVRTRVSTRGPRSGRPASAATATKPARTSAGPSQAASATAGELPKPAAAVAAA